MSSPTKDRETGPPTFSTPEGSYVLRDDIHYELSANPFIGTHFHIIARIELPASEKATQSRPIEGLPTPGKFTEVAILPDTSAGDKVDRGTMVFFADAKTSPVARRKSSRLGGLLGGNKGSSSTGPPTTMVSPPAFKDFVSKVIVNENVGQIMTDAMESIFLNVGKTFLWVNYSCQPKDPLTCLYFKDSYPTCHDVNALTRDTLDVVIGFNTGDVLWYSAITGKYIRLNRGGSIISAAVTCIKWMPGSDTTFFAGYDDGTLIVYDKERDDAEKFTPSGPGEDEWDKSQMYAHKWEGKREKFLKHNPVAWYKISRKPITDIAFSPDCQHIAVVCLDGYLKIMEYHTERLVDSYKSYFGGFTCVNWSPDGKLIITGGHDDLVTIWQFRGRILARCQGHSSWVTRVAFDPYRCTDRNYRFGSVGEDARLLLWDFGMHSLYRPRGPKSRQRAEAERKSTFGDSPGATVHQAPPRSEVPIIVPTVSKHVHGDPTCGLVFRDDAIVTSCRQGLVKIWSRPKE
ncbi:WD40 repeat-like protein [Gonapodya prolifera JEL478]|uniref:WD40 repeat-like protein n=1 Tax=Gonapodya prolifera (strain JEL478) TaxID=1344416 RepID=A0A139ATA5_GONPJ|nr:WD40 repeat-like protein [Gonapodya prolifera JEL478]|eukprot:KXS19735.1 WD40 repeat-like protein [Gonapodya prolifera JEL478]